MKLTDFFKTTVSEVMDPDYEAGAIGREGDACDALHNRQDIAVEALNDFADDFDLNVSFEIGSYIGKHGRFIKVKGQPSSVLQGTNRKVQSVRVESSNGDALVIAVSGSLPKNKEALEEINNFAKSSNVSLFGFISADNYGVKIQFYSASLFSDPKIAEASHECFTKAIKILGE